MATVDNIGAKYTTLTKIESGVIKRPSVLMVKKNGESPRRGDGRII